MDPLKWHLFFDQFNATNYQNDSLSYIDKFSYLKEYLHDAPLLAISGLTSNENYKEAIDILKQRYADSQVHINAHMETMLKVSPVTSIDNLAQLRKQETTRLKSVSEI